MSWGHSDAMTRRTWTALACVGSAVVGVMVSGVGPHPLLIGPAGRVIGGILLPLSFVVLLAGFDTCEGATEVETLKRAANAWLMVVVAGAAAEGLAALALPPGLRLAFLLGLPVGAAIFGTQRLWRRV